LIKNNCLC